MSPGDPPFEPSIHGGAVVLGETGVLIRGASGSGKSSLGEALVLEARRAGRFGALVADDRVILAVRHGRLLARPHPRLAGLVERRGLGIAPVAHEPACVIGLAVDLVEPAEAARLPEPDQRYATISGVRLDRVTLLAGAPISDKVFRTFQALEHFRARS